MRTVWLALAGALLSANAGAESIPALKLKPGDTWTYHSTAEKRTGWQQSRVESTVVRAGPTTVAVSIKPVGSTMPPTEQLMGADWSRTRSVNGHETIVNRPLAFPLSVGKTWTVEYTETHPNRQHSSEHHRAVYGVAGWEDVTVPAGTFHALKIEADGERTATMAPAVGGTVATRLDEQGATTVVQSGKTAPATVSGRLYKGFWYVPAVKRWVKPVEEYYDSNGVRNERYADELESDKLSD